MVDKKQLEEVYKQNLENDIINAISEMKGIDLRKAFDIYYSSNVLHGSVKSMPYSRLPRGTPSATPNGTSITRGAIISS